MINLNTLKMCTHMMKLNKGEVTEYFSKQYQQIQNFACQFTLSSQSQQSNDSIKKIHKSEYISMCLHCGCFLCDLQCILKHQKQFQSKNQHHLMTLSIANFLVRCGACEDDLQSMLLAYAGDEKSNQYLRAVRFTNYLKQGWIKIYSKFYKLRTGNTANLGGSHPSFKNLGNTCFLNVTLQLLYSCKQLTERYKNLQFMEGTKKHYNIINKQIQMFYDEMIEKKQSQTWHVVSSKNKSKKNTEKFLHRSIVTNSKMNSLFKNMIIDLEINLKQPFQPYQILKELSKTEKRYINGQEHDADEVMTLLMDILSQGEMCAFDYDKQRYQKIESLLGRQKLSITQNIFGSYLASRLKCRQCKRVQWTLDLTFQWSVQMQLAQGKVHNQSYNLLSQNNCDLQQKVCVNYPWQLKYPSILPSKAIPNLIKGFFSEQLLTKDNNYFTCLHCSSLTATKKLFAVSPPQILILTLKRFHGLKKNMDFVQFPLQMNVQGVFLQSEQTEIYQYRLFAVVVHEGKTFNSGHYVVYLNQNGSNQWVCCSDALVRAVSWRQVKCQNVYILAYQKIVNAKK